MLSRRTSPLTPDATVCASTLLLAVSFLATAVLPGAMVLFAATAFAGLGEGPQLTALFTIRHREAPPEVRAQVFTTAASVKVLGLALGAGLAGPLTGVSVYACLLAATGAQLLAALIYLLFSISRVRTPSPARGA
ncbi:hypothetical protein [Amycolatopsis sp. H20-H5]|uniref:hypothetical protein n=1 Tax=Amycolatopsis sp. H20-H5 TaxID=3046309 RepID=UPI002DB65623|nr:hypothetical protein [Amycolatopsis sp. H20-H5]MEC3980017.1 hypothetical protein [Amycolatopsis sp. H20-H5]